MLEIRDARPEDVGSITSCVCEAYMPYIERIGKQPAPMLADYADTVSRHNVQVAVQRERVQGLIVLVRAGDAMWLENIAVRPECRGSGLGGLLLASAERIARDAGFQALDLYTNECMTENQAWYGRRGFVEVRRDRVDGYDRVYFRKAIAR